MLLVCSRPDNLINNQTGMELAVTEYAMVARFGLEPGSKHLLASCLALCPGDDLCTLNDWPANCYHRAITDEQHFIQLYGLSLGYRQTVNINDLAGSYPVLFASGFNDSVNFPPPSLDHRILPVTGLRVK